MQKLSNHQRATSRPVRGMGAGGGGAGRMGGVADMGALRPDAIDRPSTRLPNAPTRLLLLSSLASRLAALGWGIGARGVCAHAYGRADQHASAALYAPIDHPARSQHANSQAVLVSLLQSCFLSAICFFRRLHGLCEHHCSSIPFSLICCRVLFIIWLVLFVIWLQLLSKYQSGWSTVLLL